MRYALAVSVLLALGCTGQATGADRPLRLAQSQTSAACMNNCNSAYATCANQCPVAGTASQIAPDVNVAELRRRDADEGLGALAVDQAA